jgi:hypothetical protein
MEVEREMSFKRRQFLLGMLLLTVGGMLLGVLPPFHTYETSASVVPGEEANAFTFSARKQLLLLVPELDFSAWEAIERAAEAYPHLHMLLQKGGVGAVSARTLGKGVEDVYATMGAGAPAGSDKDVFGLNRQEEKSGLSAERLYLRYRGESSGAAGVLIPEFAQVEQMTARTGFLAVPGLLGESLKAAQIPLYAYGNADGEHRVRFSTLVLADRQGRVASGDVGADVLQKDAASSFGVRMNGGKLSQLWKAAAQEAVVSVEWGDLSRLEEERPKYSSEQYDLRKMAVLQELDRFIGDCVSRMSEGEGIWVVSVGKHYAPRQPGTLIPLLYYEPGIQGGLLTSKSTRRPGIVTLYDVTASVLSRYTDSQPLEMLGHSIQADHSHTQTNPAGSYEAWTRLKKELKGIRSVYVLRPKLLLPFAGYEAVVLLAALLCASWTSAAASSLGRRRFRALLRGLLLSLLAAPLAMLVLGWLVVVRPVEPVVLVVGFGVLVLAGSLAGSRRPLHASVTLAALTAIALLADGLSGAEGMKRSLLGYDPVVGARFYGMGNEYMGMLLGATVLAVSFGLELMCGRLGPYAKRGGRREGEGGAGRGHGAGAVCEGERGAGRERGAGAGVRRSGGEAKARESEAGARRERRAEEACEGERGAGRDREAGMWRSGVEAEACEGELGARRKCDMEPLAPRAIAATRQRKLRLSRVAAAAAVAAYAGVELYLAAPQLGSEAGGAIAGVVAFGLACRRSLARLPGRSASPGATAVPPVTRVSRSSQPIRGWLGLALTSVTLVALAVAGLWLLNAALPQPASGQSHIGSALGWLHEGRFDLVQAMILRKLQMNLHLLSVSAWSKVLLAGLLVMLTAVLRTKELYKLQSSHPYLTDGCSAITIGAIVALLFNDSGIVAAGTMIIYAAIPMLLLKLQVDEPELGKCSTRTLE